MGPLDFWPMRSVKASCIVKKKGFFFARRGFAVDFLFKIFCWKDCLDLF